MSTSTKKRFEGSTIEDALASAVSTLGEDLEILDAQRVLRRRPLGVRRRERFEVTASKRSVVEPKDFGDVLQRMVDRVDEAESLAGADLADSDESWWPAAQLLLPDEDGFADLMPRHGRPEPEIELDVRVEPARARRAASVERREAPVTPREAPGTLTTQARQILDDAIAVPAHAPQPVADSPPLVIESDSPNWSIEALLALELPPALIGRIRADDLNTDLDWVAAVAKAISELLQLAGDMSGPCELTGHGAGSVVHLIRGACDGFRLDSLIIDDRRVPATPLELALAIRSLLRDA